MLINNIDWFMSILVCFTAHQDAHPDKFAKISLEQFPSNKL